MTSDSRLHDQPLSALYSVSVRAVPSISNRSHRIQRHQQQQRSLQTTADTQRIRSIKYSRPESINGDVDGAMDTPRHCSTNSSTPLRPSIEVVVLLACHAISLSFQPVKKRRRALSAHTWWTFSSLCRAHGCRRWRPVNLTLNCTN